MNQLTTKVRPTKRYETHRKNLDATGKGFEDKLLEMANQTRRLAAVREAIGLLKDTFTRPTMNKTEANERYDLKESMNSLKEMVEENRFFKWGLEKGYL